MKQSLCMECVEGDREHECLGRQFPTSGIFCYGLWSAVQFQFWSKRKNEEETITCFNGKNLSEPRLTMEKQSRKKGCWFKKRKQIWKTKLKQYKTPSSLFLTHTHKPLPNITTTTHLTRCLPKAILLFAFLWIPFPFNEQDFYFFWWLPLVLSDNFVIHIIQLLKLIICLLNMVHGNTSHFHFVVRIYSDFVA